MMVRKSVMIGFGLWLLAVATVAAIASLAIDTAGRQVTAVADTGPLPDVGGSQEPTASTPASTTPGGTSKPSATRPKSTSTQRPAVQGHFGILITDGGRVRARCADRQVTLDGGFARPEPGWKVRVLARDNHLWVIFGSRVRAIAVLAHCSGGRPVFRQHSETFASRTPSPPATTPQDTPVPATSLADPSVQPLVQPVGTPTTAIEPDPAQVEAFVRAQDASCARFASSTGWCHKWVRLTDREKYALVWQWLASLPGNGASLSAGSALVLRSDAAPTTDSGIVGVFTP
jgi:hypothetical protein